MSTVLHIRDLELPGREVEIRRVGLEVECGEVVGIAGPPGSGKTTLLRMLAGAAPARAARLEVLGVDAMRAPRRVWESVGYLRGHQDPLRSDEPVQSALRHHGALKRMPAATLERAVRLQLRRVGLLDQSGAALRSLASDDRLRLAMAQTWLDSPRLVFLDDPLTGASPAAAEQFLASFEEWLLESDERTAVVVGRSLRPFAALCTRAFVIRGRGLTPVSPWDLP